MRLNKKTNGISYDNFLYSFGFSAPLNKMFDGQTHSTCSQQSHRLLLLVVLACNYFLPQWKIHNSFALRFCARSNQSITKRWIRNSFYFALSLWASLWGLLPHLLRVPSNPIAFKTFSSVQPDFFPPLMSQSGVRPSCSKVSFSTYLDKCRRHF